MECCPCTGCCHTLSSAHISVTNAPLGPLLICARLQALGELPAERFAVWKEWVAQYRAVLQEEALDEAERMAMQASPAACVPVCIELALHPICCTCRFVVSP